MRIESSVTSVSWIPSAAVGGTARIPFEAGVPHYDSPPPDHWADVDSVIGPQGARFGNELRAWIEVDDGRIRWASSRVSARQARSNVARCGLTF